MRPKTGHETIEFSWDDKLFDLVSFRVLANLFYYRYTICSTLINIYRHQSLLRWVHRQYEGMLVSSCSRVLFCSSMTKQHTNAHTHKTITVKFPSHLHFIRHKNTFPHMYVFCEHHIIMYKQADPLQYLAVEERSIPGLQWLFVIVAKASLLSYHGKRDGKTSFDVDLYKNSDMYDVRSTPNIYVVYLYAYHRSFDGTQAMRLCRIFVCRGVNNFTAEAILLNTKLSMSSWAKVCSRELRKI